MNTITENFSALGLAVIETELEAIQQLKYRLGTNFELACQILLKCQGRIVVLGMGKSGHIGGKIAATLASTGSPAFFIHPGEANHGDLGMIIHRDVVLAISNSGETPEILTLLPLIKRLGVPLLSLCGQPSSTIARAADVNLDVSVKKEACPLGLAPTASTTATLVMGDALAIALLHARGFTADEFAKRHPGGALGRRLLLHVDSLMHRDDEIPKVSPRIPISQALITITAKRLGMTTIVDEQGCLLGIFTDGDLRRTLDQACDLQNTAIEEVMTRNCVTVFPNLLAVEALQLMQTHKISAVVVTNQYQQVIGVVHLHDLLRAGVA